MLLWESEALARASSGVAHPVGYPTRAQAAVVSPSTATNVSQDWLEERLRDNLASLDAVRLQMGTELLALDNTTDGVRAVTRDASGRSSVVHARYAVAADGAHSFVRRRLGIRMHGPDETLTGRQVLFRAPIWELLGSVRYLLYWVTTSNAEGLFLPAGRGDRWIYAPGGDDTADLEHGRLLELIRRGAGVPDLEPQIERISTFHAAGQLADRFRSGNVFLAGDAAHRVTPRGGTGMNVALHSGADLGWKLAWALRGWADTELLDTYESERRTAVAHNVARSNDPAGSRRRVDEELHVDLGGRLTHVWVRSGSRRVSTLDLLGPGWTLFTGPSRREWEAAAAAVPSHAPVVVRDLDAVSARALGVVGEGALLARPDGVPVAIWPSSAGATAELARAVRLVARPAGVSDRAA